ncbi:MAG: HAMP domain-containing sensor histidine kinase, partial [Fulvivirga sp.]
FSDNGIGIDLKEHGKNLFQPFKRFSQQATGKGIGLSIIKSMIEKNNGKIEVESAPGEGSTFLCYLCPYK